MYELLSQTGEALRDAAQTGTPQINKSLYRALQILDCFTERTPEWGVSELSRRLGISKSSVSTILATLASMDLVYQSPTTRRYQLGLRCLDLGYLVSSRLIIRDFALPYLEELQDGDRIVYMGIPYQDEVLYIEALFPPRRKINYSSIGRRAPFYCTGIGKAMLAYMPPAYVDGYLKKQPLVAATDNTITEPARLRQELAQTRQRGYAVDRQEREWGIQCVGVPICRSDGGVIAAISVSGPSSEITEDKMPALAEQLLRASRNIARKLTSAGY